MRLQGEDLARRADTLSGQHRSLPDVRAHIYDPLAGAAHTPEAFHVIHREVEVGVPSDLIVQVDLEANAVAGDGAHRPSRVLVVVRQDPDQRMARIVSARESDQQPLRNAADHPPTKCIEKAGTHGRMITARCAVPAGPHTTSGAPSDDSRDERRWTAAGSALEWG